MSSPIKDRFELDPSAFSPTELDDSFMLYYRHPKLQPKDTETTIIKANLPDNITVAAVVKNKPDFSQHPISCQKYLQNGQDISPSQTTANMKIKSLGTDDGFKGEAAKCGSSIIKVASQMVSSQGLGIRSSENCIEEPIYDGRRRRGSKSLPASPLTSPASSPKANRKINKYFTGAFTDIDKSKGSWILSNLLARRDMSQSVGQIKEELAEELDRAASTASIDEIQSKKPSVFKAKPSELREMNFWSPTSM